jgi:hypothetical protein
MPYPTLYSECKEAMVLCIRTDITFLNQDFILFRQESNDFFPDWNTKVLNTKL